MASPDLFSHAVEQHLASRAPLAARLRPTTLDEVVGQQHLVGPHSPLRVLIESDQLTSVVLWGPPGTGKTCLGHWIARQLEIPVSIKRASDIISPYIGTTERNLARAFETARSDKALLLIDEVDTFLQDRTRAHRSWEVSQVDEMLTQMEQFPGIFIASTNIEQGLDPASLRRFDLKVHFDYLRPNQVQKLLQRHTSQLALGHPTPKQLNEAATLSNATPGDFANTARQHHFQQFKTPTDFLQALIQECQIKTKTTTRKAGFC
jgi:replication-associated recombination protein RarA